MEVQHNHGHGCYLIWGSIKHMSGKWVGGGYSHENAAYPGDGSTTAIEQVLLTLRMGEV